MKILLNGKVFEGTAVEILESMRQDHFDANRFASIKEYMTELQQNAWKFFAKGIHPVGETIEEKAVSLLNQLHEVGFIRIEVM